MKFRNVLNKVDIQAIEFVELIIIVILFDYRK